MPLDDIDTAMLAGWIAGGVSLTVQYAMVDEGLLDSGVDTGPTLLFALILIGALVTTVFFARAAPMTSDRGSQQPQPPG
jgi:hypothetical protein